MTHLSLFTGIGGLDLAAEWAGFETVAQCEWADYPTKVLESHWPGVPRWRDIRTLTKESFDERTGMRTVDLISGGFPCQPFSVAGKRRGCEDDRYLWPEMLRVIEELRPCWVIGENVAGIVNMALDTVLSDLESIGYTAGSFVIPACAVDAPHRRDRCAIVAFNNSFGRRENGKQKRLGRILVLRKDDTIPPQKCGSDVSHSDSANVQSRISFQNPPGRAEPTDQSGRTVKPGLGGMADGLPHWVDEPLNVPRVARGIKDWVNRLKCLGNAVVPQQFYPIFRAIAQLEGEEK